MSDNEDNLSISFESTSITTASRAPRGDDSILKESDHTNRNIDSQRRGTATVATHSSHSKSPSVGLPSHSDSEKENSDFVSTLSGTVPHSNGESPKQNAALLNDVNDDSTSRGVPRPHVSNDGDGQVSSVNDDLDSGSSKSQRLIVMGESKMNPLDLICEGGIYIEDPSNHISKCVSAFFDDNKAYHTVIEPCSNIETWKSITGNENIKVTHVSNVPENIRDIGSKILSRRDSSADMDTNSVEPWLLDLSAQI